MFGQVNVRYSPKRGESMKNILHNIIESIDDEDILKNILFHNRTINVSKKDRYVLS